MLCLQNNHITAARERKYWIIDTYSADFDSEMDDFSDPTLIPYFIFAQRLIDMKKEMLPWLPRADWKPHGLKWTIFFSFRNQLWSGNWMKPKLLLLQGVISMLFREFIIKATTNIRSIKIEAKKKTLEALLVKAFKFSTMQQARKSDSEGPIIKFKCKTHERAGTSLSQTAFHRNSASRSRFVCSRTRHCTHK